MSRATQPRTARGTRPSVGCTIGRKCLVVFSVAAFALLALASSASATTVTANVSGAGTGSASSPQGVVATIKTTTDNDTATPPFPVGQTETLSQTFPSEFISNLASFEGCPESKYNGKETSAGGPEDPLVSCPAKSIVGTGSFKSEVSAGFSVASEEAVIVKDSTTGGLAFWTTFTCCGGAHSGIVPGTVSTNGAGQTVISWDPREVAEPEGPFTVSVAEFTTVYNDNQAALQTLEPFSNTGCASGTWTFTVTQAFIGGNPATQTANATAPCTVLTPPTAGTVTVKSKKVKVSKSGKGKIKLQCSTVGPCAGSFEIRSTGKKKSTIARGSYSLSPGTTAGVSFKLNSKGKSLLAKHKGKLKTKLKLKQPDGSSTVSSLVLTAPKPKH